MKVRSLALIAWVGGGGGGACGARLIESA